MSAPVLVDRPLPQNLEAERSLLGAILLHNDAVVATAGVLDPSDFCRVTHQWLFAAMRQLAEAGRPIDLVTVQEALGTRLAEVGPAYITSLVDGLPRASNIESYARIIRGKAQLRAMIATATRILAQAYDADEDIAQVLDQAEQSLMRLKAGERDGGLKPLGDSVVKLLDQIEAWGKAPGHVTGVPSGFADLDAMTRGFHHSQLIIVAARPAMGKSAFVLNIAHHVASTGRVVAFFSLEMSSEELAVRSVSAEAAIDSHRLQRGRIYETEWGRLSHAIGTLAERSLFIDESPFVTVFDIKARCRRLQTQQALDLVIVDYTQLMIGHEKHQNRTLELAAITRSLKALSKELHVPVIALSQLNRDLERRENKRPVLSDLRDSGALEQDADVVVFLYRDEVYHPNSEDRGVAEVIVSKQRQGPLGTVRLGWHGAQTRFVNLTTDTPMREWTR